MVRESFFKRLFKKEMVKEDFITEILSGVFTSLTIPSTEKIIELFEELGFPKLPFSNPYFETQRSNPSGRNDLVIRDDNIIIVFENKWDSKTYLEQLHRYDEELSNENKPFRFLVHLTKDYEEINDKFKNDFKKINWSDLYNALKKLKLTEKYLIEQFLNFLEEEGVAMEKVSWEIVNGAKSIYNLVRIIGKACEDLGYKWEWAKATSSLYTGQIIENKLYVYFLIDQACLLFWSAKPQPNISDMNIRWGNGYGIKFDFDKYYFFHRNLEAQVEAIKEFIKELLSKME